MNPFLTFSVLPAFGVGQAAITWSLRAGLTGSVFFYRSESGVPGSWELLNPAAPQTGSSGEFVDTDLAVDEFSFVHYRGLLDPGGGPATWLKGPDVTALEEITRREYFIAREILRREYQSMSGPLGNGLEAWHFIPRKSGAAAANADTETRQLLGPDCEDATHRGYGTLWDGGFYPPVRTWIRIMSLSPLQSPDSAGATGEDTTADVNLRLLAFPQPARDHVIVLAKSDRRYVIEPAISPFYLRGALPLFWEAKASMLDHDDPRYDLLSTALTQVQLDTGENVLVASDQLVLDPS